MKSGPSFIPVLEMESITEMPAEVHCDKELQEGHIYWTGQHISQVPVSWRTLAAPILCTYPIVSSKGKNPRSVKNLMHCSSSQQQPQGTPSQLSSNSLQSVLYKLSTTIILTRVSRISDVDNPKDKLDSARDLVSCAASKLFREL